jgi:uncharacterized membrane protein YbaN (DUF454 family)
VLGTLALGIGAVGLFLPVLPTTPFLLIALGCYVRSSERLYTWLRQHPRFGPAVQNYVEKKGVPLRVKVISLTIAWAVLGGTALLIDRVPLQVLLIAVAVGKTFFMIRIKTLRQDGESESETEMNDRHDAPQPKRQYPPLYERMVPIALGIIAAIILILLLIIFSVALGFFPGTG